MPGQGARGSVHFNAAPVKFSRGTKLQIVSLGAISHAMPIKRQDRASATMFFFPSMKNTRRSIWCLIRVLTDSKMIGLYRSRAQRELKMLKEVEESVCMAKHFRGGDSEAAHCKAASTVSASLKKMLN